MKNKALESSNFDSVSDSIARVENETPELLLIAGGRTSAHLSSTQLSLSIEHLRIFGEDWINDALSLRQSPATLTGKRDAIARLIWFLKYRQLNKCGPRELQQFVAYIGNGHLEPGGRWGNPALVKPASDRTVQYYANYIKGFCRWMVKDPYIPVDVDLSASLRIVKPSKEKIEPFSIEQINALLLAARHSAHPKRDEAVLLFMLDTGVRASEVCELLWGNVQLHHGYGTARVLGKGRKERTVPFSRIASRALWRYTQEVPRGELSPLFFSDRGRGGHGNALTRSGLGQLFERLGKAAGIKAVRCSPHTMRHTFAINFLRNGGNTFSLQVMLGHEDLKMTEHYSKLARADINDQHAQFSPADGLQRRR